MSVQVSIATQIQTRWIEFMSGQSLSDEVIEKQQFIQSFWQQSPYCERVCQLYPQSLDDLALMNAERLTPSVIRGKIFDSVNQMSDEVQIKQHLRQIRHQLLLQICWKDLILNAEVFDVLQELSDIADAFVQTSVDWMTSTLTRKYGVPRSDQGEKVHFVVIAMGKLGGGRRGSLKQQIKLVMGTHDRNLPESPTRRTTPETTR